MPKSDKELVAEIACAYLQAHSGEGRRAPTLKDLQDVINGVYETIRKLENEAD